MFSPFDLHRPFYTQRPFAPLLGHRFATRCRSGDTHGRCPASPLLWPRPTPRFAFAIARPPKFLTELSRRVVLLCPAAPARPKPIRTLGVGFTASELLATRNSSNETLRRRFICIATHLFVRQDSRIRVTPLTACSALRAIPSLRSALTAFGGYVLITSRFVCDSCSFHHDSSAKLVLAYQTLTHSSCLSHLNPDPEEPPPALRGRLHRRPRLEDYNN